MDWSLYDNGLRHERVKLNPLLFFPSINSVFSWTFALLQQEYSQSLRFEQSNLTIYSIIIFIGS